MIDELAHQFILVKFIWIKAGKKLLVFKYKDVPTVINCHDNNLIKQLILASYYFWGTGNLIVEKVEWIFESLKVLKSELENDPFDKENNYKIFKISKKNKKEKEYFESDSDDDGRKKIESVDEILKENK